MNRSYLKIKEKFFQNKKGRTPNIVKNDHYYYTNEPDDFIVPEYENDDDVVVNNDSENTMSNNDTIRIDNELLNRLFDLFDNGAHKTYTIYICILVSGTFLMEKSDTGFSFPHFSYQAPELPENEKDKDEEYSPENIHFSNTCIQYAVDILNLEIHSEDTDLASFYTGFLPYDENTLFTFFDFTAFSNKIEKKWFGTMDDIVVHKSINRIPVDPVISDFFVENRKFYILHS